MANTPASVLVFKGNCPDCGAREVHLPAALPEAGDDFDWRVRDYDGFRMFMLEELAARFPERTRWTPADLEVVLVEVFATVLDQLSDMLDRVATEAFLETARRPDTVRQLLSFIGYDAVLEAKAKDQIPDELHGEEAIESLEKFWRQNHHAMAKAKRLGPQSVHTQKRMVTLEDYALRIREHPLVMHAHARSEWTGSWYTIQLCVIAWENLGLDETPGEAEGTLTYSSELINDINNFHQALGVREPFYSDSYTPSVRTVLRPYLDALRMAGQEVILQDPIYIGIYMSISVRLATGFFHSEMQHAITQVLGHGPAGFFAPGRHGFGEDLYASDIIEAIMTLKGVEHVCLNRFKRIGSQYPDRAAAGFIILNGTEVVRCDNDFSEPEYGYYQLTLHGGRKG